VDRVASYTGLTHSSLPAETPAKLNAIVEHLAWVEVLSDETDGRQQAVGTAAADVAWQRQG
jgi:hypothetical protein